MARFTDAYVRKPGPAASASLTIADDDFATYDPTFTVLIVTVFTEDGAEGGSVLVNVDSAGATAKALGKTTNVNATTGALSGSTGTDAKLTISAHTDGLVYIENRLAAEQTVLVRETL